MTSPDDTTTNDRRSDHRPTDATVPAAEPFVDVPAGLLATAIELLDLCDEVFNHPGSNTTDAQVAAVINRHQPATTNILRWFHDRLCDTASDLQELLDDRGITAEPNLRHRPTPHH